MALIGPYYAAFPCNISLSYIWNFYPRLLLKFCIHFQNPSPANTSFHMQASAWTKAVFLTDYWIVVEFFIEATVHWWSWRTWHLTLLGMAMIQTISCKGKCWIIHLMVDSVSLCPWHWPLTQLVTTVQN